MGSALPVFLYDGDCGVCDRGTARMRARMRPAVEFAAYQRTDLARLGLLPTALDDGPVLVFDDGRYVVGAAAVAGVMQRARRPYKALGAVLAAPGVRIVAQRFAVTLYHNRHRLPGADSSCAVTTTPV